MKRLILILVVFLFWSASAQIPSFNSFDPSGFVVSSFKVYLNTNAIKGFSQTNQLQVFPWVSNDPFRGITNSTPDYPGELGISFLQGQVPYMVIGRSHALSDWDYHGIIFPYGVSAGDATRMGTNGFEHQFIVNGCWSVFDPTNQVTAADAVMMWQNQNSKHYSAVRWVAANAPGGDGSEKGAIGYGNTNANGYAGMDFIEDYADGQGFYFAGSGNLRGGKLRGTSGDFVWFTNTLAASIGADVVGNASFLINGADGGVTNKSGMQAGTTLTAVNGDVILGSAGHNVRLLGTNISIGDGGNLNLFNGSFGRMILNARGDVCTPTLSFANIFSSGVDANGNWMLGWCSGTIGTNILVDVGNHEVYITNGTTHIGPLEYQKKTQTKTSNYAVTVADSGTIFDNNAAGGAVTNTLPAAVAGLHYSLDVETAQNLAFKGNGTDTIRNAASVSAAGGLIFASTIGNQVHVHCSVAGKWVVDSIIGSWTVQ